MTALERLQKQLKEEDALKAKSKDISGVLKAARKGESAHLDPRKGLAQLGYGRELAVDKEVAAANAYRKEKGLPPLNTDPITVKPTDNPASGSYYNPNEGYIKNRTEQSIAKPSQIYGYTGGEVESPVEVLGHELTHAMTDDDDDIINAKGLAEPRRWKSGKDDYNYIPIGKTKSIAQTNYERATYPEYAVSEFAPPLAAMTRLAYQTTGKRIDTPEKFDKKIAEYDAMSSKEKSAFKKNLPTEVSRFYNYLDTVSDPEAEDLRLWGTDGANRNPVRLEGKDRRKRFLDISREMIPSLVEKEDSFEEAINRRMS